MALPQEPDDSDDRMTGRGVGPRFLEARTLLELIENVDQMRLRPMGRP